MNYEHTFPDLKDFFLCIRNYPACFKWYEAVTMVTSFSCSISVLVPLHPNRTFNYVLTRTLIFLSSAYESFLKSWTIKLCEIILNIGYNI